jgi:hypothetical protein
VRQDDSLWDELHAGVFTSSTLIGATALCERAAAKQIPGWRHYMLNHGSALSAATRLAQPLHASYHAPSATELEAALSGNHRVMHHINRFKLQRRASACEKAQCSAAQPDPASGAVSLSPAASSLAHDHAAEENGKLQSSDTVPWQNGGLDVSWLGVPVTTHVQVCNGNGPLHRRTKVWSLHPSAPTSTAAAAKPSGGKLEVPGEADSNSVSQSEWLEGTALGPTSQKSRNRKKKNNKKKLGTQSIAPVTVASASSNEQQAAVRVSEASAAELSGDVHDGSQSVRHSTCHSNGETSGLLYAPEVDPLEALEHEAFLQRVHRNAQVEIPRHLAFSQGVARQGEHCMRTTYGRVQEATGLLDVLHMFKNSTVHEAGLFMLPPECVPKEWGIDMQALQVGASPDGLIFHPPCDAGTVSS